MAPLVTGSASPAGTQERSKVKLVIQITVDGLRDDLLNRYGDLFGKGGFCHLLHIADGFEGFGLVMPAFHREAEIERSLS